MSVLGFNCQGLGKPQAVKDLRGILRRLSPKLVFLSEIKKSRREIEEVKVELGDFYEVYMDARGRAGGLALLWDKSVNPQSTFVFIPTHRCFHSVGDRQVQVESYGNIWLVTNSTQTRDGGDDC